MDIASILKIGQLVIELVRLGVSLPSELKALAERVEAGEEITDEELDQAREAVKTAKRAWHDSN